jgi:hypothetical protein
MRTLKEEQEHRTVEGAAEVLRRRAFVLWLESRSIPLASDSLEEKRVEIRIGFRDGRYTAIGYACETCRTELVNICPGMLLLSNPPKRTVGCPGCGWKGDTTL